MAQKSPKETIGELKELLIAYLKQETLEPLKGLRRFILFGLLGATLLGLGVLFCGMAGLRALQTETGSRFTGSWSWAPYAITVTGLLAGAGITWKARGGRSSEQ